MGAYLSTPITDKDTSNGSSESAEWGVSSMQGWRRTMEDAHLATTDEHPDGEVGIYGVFDGHGGSEVAKFCHSHLAEELAQTDSYQQGHVGEALIQVFHRMDEMLRLPAATAELERYRGNTGGRVSEPPASRASASKSQPPSADAGAEDSTEQQQTLDVMKRILEIKRMVTEGAAANNGNGGSEPSSSGTASDSTFKQPQQLRDPAALATSHPLLGSSRAEGAEADSEQCGQVGCTAVVAVLKGGDLYIANAGDSRAVLGRGKLAVPLSEDHKPASASEKARITNAGGFVSEVGGVTRVNGNLNLSRAIGDLRYKGNSEVARDAQIITAEPDVRRVTVLPEDRFFLMACDGIWDVLSNQQAVDFVNDRLDRGEATSTICEQLLDICLAKNPKEARGIGCDNMTAQIVLFTVKARRDDAAHAAASA